MSTRKIGAHSNGALQIRYAQCWEDADILVEALNIQPGAHCLSVCSAGDNSLALLAYDPARVVAIDRNPAQLFCLELRVAAYRELEHCELLQLIGSRPSSKRSALYQRCRSQLSSEAKMFWDARPELIHQGIGAAGKFERYFEIFRHHVLPFVHARSRVQQLLRGGSLEQRHHFYNQRWNSLRWRLMFHLFFSRAVMARLGRDRSAFSQVQGSVAGRILQRVQYALTELNPAENPYLHWILTGRHGTALPFALREENFEPIRTRLDRLEWHCASLDEYLETAPAKTFHAFNMSDVFEYLSLREYYRYLALCVRAAAPSARLAYWNMLVSRRRPVQMASQIAPQTQLSKTFHARDKAFFYRDFVVEEIQENVS